MNKTFNGWFGDSEEAKRLYAQESLIIDTSEDFLALMEDMGVTKSKLSKLVGKSKSFVTQSLNGTRNLTLRTLADMAFALDVEVKINFEVNDKQFSKSVDDSDYFVETDTISEIKLESDDFEQKNNVIDVDFTKNTNFDYQTQYSWIA